MGVKKLHSVFMRYVLLLALAVLLVIGVNVAVYLFGVETGAVVPLNRISAAIESSKVMRLCLIHSRRTAFERFD